MTPYETMNGEPHGGSGFRPGGRETLLSTAQMRAADAAAIAGGVPGLTLMERAGGAVAEGAAALAQGRPVLVLAGPGNNGGDGFVAARILSGQGLKVRLALLGTRQALRGDAALAAETWPDEVIPLDGVARLEALLADRPVVVDALFGAGLIRPLEGTAAAAAAETRARALDVLAVDIPSGVDGDTGAALGAEDGDLEAGAFQAAATVTFCRAKPGHYLYPGRALAGRLTVADIGIRDETVAGVAGAEGTPVAWRNGPRLWAGAVPHPLPEDHKYSRGHGLILGGTDMPGAARLAAMAARRAGAGLVTVAARPDAVPLYLAAEPGLLVRALEDAGDLVSLAASRRVTAILAGPGLGIGAETRDRVLAGCRTGVPLVLDADGLSAFEADPGALLDALKALQEIPVLTPHGGEFRRLFPGVEAEVPGKLAQARLAAAASGAVVVFKGPDTVVASPDGQAVINANGTADLATAGTGDVLAGLVLALRARGMAAFPAAAAAVWLHGAAGAAIGPGLIAEDLPAALAQKLAEIRPLP